MKISNKTETEFNTEEYFNAYPDGIEVNFWNITRNKIIFRYIKKYKLDNIIDIGCGRGIVTNFLAKRGLNITGVETGVAKPIGKDSVIYYDTDALLLPESLRLTFKTILLLDVIEHIEQPVIFLKDILTGFPNVENVLITVPACKELWSNYDTYYGHFRRYDPLILESQLIEAGLKISKKRYIFHSLYLTMRLKLKWEKERPISFQAPKGLISKFINRLIGSMMYYETLLIPGNLKGSSLLCVVEINSN